MPWTVLALGPRMTNAEGRRHDKGGYCYETYVLRDPVTRPMCFEDKLVANQFIIVLQTFNYTRRNINEFFLPENFLSLKLFFNSMAEINNVKIYI